VDEMKSQDSNDTKPPTECSRPAATTSGPTRLTRLGISHYFEETQLNAGAIGYESYGDASMIQGQ
jgi:hypothetical protein